MSDDFVRLLDVLERKPDERLSINAMWNGRFQSRIVTVAEAPQIAVQLVGTDCWYGTAVLHERVQSGRGYARDVIGVRELYADLDYKPGALTPQTAPTVIDDLAAMLGVTPVAVVHSGGGVQPHWQLDRSDVIDWGDENDSMHGIVTALWRRWGRLVRHVAERRGGTVDGVYDLSRVLRVPGTVNTKYDPPRPVTVEYPGGAPVTLTRLAEALDEFDVPELRGDRDALDEVVAPPADWQWARQTCRYVERMIAGWDGDTPTARHPWLVSNAIRIAAAHRAGCITQADHQQAVEALASRFAVLVGPGTPLRPNGKIGPQPGELPDAFSWGIARASTFDQTRALRELGSHRHNEDTTAADDAEQESEPHNPLGQVLRRSELSSLPTVDHLVHRFISTPATVVLVGGYGVGKTFLAIGLGNSVGSGLQWLGRTVQRCRVLYVLGEGAYGLDHRMTAWESAWNKGDLVADDDVTFVVQPDSLHRPSTWSAITEMAKTGDFGFVILDTFSSLAPDADETKDAAMIMRRMSNLSTIILGTVMLVHHPGWSDATRVRGGSQLESNADEVLVAQEISKGSDIFTVTRKKVKDGPAGQVLYLRRRPHNGSVIIEEVQADQAGMPMRERILVVLANMGAIGATGPQIMKELGVEDVHRSAFYKALNKLTKDDGGQVADITIGNFRRYFLRAEDDEQ